MIDWCRFYYYYLLLITDDKYSSSFAGSSICSFQWGGCIFAWFNDESVSLWKPGMHHMLTDTTNWRYSSSIALSPLPRSLHQSLILSHFAAYVHLAAVSARAAGFGETVVEPVWTSNYQFVQLGCPRRVHPRAAAGNTTQFPNGCCRNSLFLQTVHKKFRTPLSHCMTWW